jgi:phosphomannomutase
MTTNPAAAIKFGTDGWRGLIARDFTFDNVAICASAYARYLKESDFGKRGIIIGYDTRFLSEAFAKETALVLCAAGIKVTLSCRAVPTPIVSWSVLNAKAGGGVVITASGTALRSSRRPDRAPRPRPSPGLKNTLKHSSTTQKRRRR